MKAAMVLWVIMVVGISGCSVQDRAEEKELAHKHWASETYRKISNVYDPDSGNYAIVEIEAKADETKVCFSLGNGRVLTFRDGDDTAYRSLPSEVKYPGTGQWLEVREAYLMKGKKEVDYIYRKW